jgi:C4-dicarboxylate-specific signal transduction histidine kinase
MRILMLSNGGLGHYSQPAAWLSRGRLPRRRLDTRHLSEIDTDIVTATVMHALPNANSAAPPRHKGEQGPRRLTRWLAAAAVLGTAIALTMLLRRSMAGHERVVEWIAQAIFLGTGASLAWLCSRQGETLRQLRADLEDRKRAEAALRRTEAYLVEAERLSHTGSWVYDIKLGAPVYWSAERRRISRFDPQRSIPTLEEYRALHCTEEWARLMEAFNRGIREKTDFQIDVTERLSDGTERILRIVGHPVLNSAGEVTELIGSTMDLTERMRMTEALRVARANLSRMTRLTMMGEFAASIAHEVNQPLAAMVTNANACLRWLDRESPDLAEARESVRYIIRDGNRGSDVIARIRTLLRKGRPSSAPLNLNEVIQEIISLTQVELQGITLRLDLDSALPVVSADRVQLQQVMLNLVTNAADAMKTSRERTLRIRTQLDPGRVALVAIEDSGVGLKASQMDQLFEPFYTTKPDGLGLGLSISRSIIEAHGGRLWAETGAGRGAIFKFTVPLDPDEVP